MPHLRISDDNTILTPHTLCQRCNEICQKSILLSTIPILYEAGHLGIGLEEGFAKEEEEQFLHLTYAELEASYSECHFCTMIIYILNDFDEAEILRRPIWKSQNDDEDRLILVIKDNRLVEECQVGFKFSGRDLLAGLSIHSAFDKRSPNGSTQFNAQLAISTASEETFDLAKFWISQCTSSHERCNAVRPSGLPTRLIDIGDGQRSGMHYVSGLWAELLRMGLLWSRCSSNPSHAGTRLERAPSWSWQSIDRPVEYFSIHPLKLTQSVYVATVLDCRVDPAQDRDANIGGTEGVLRIKGYLRKTLKWYGDENNSIGLQAVLVGLKKDRVFNPDIIIDKSAELFFLLIALDTTTDITPCKLFVERGLVLTQSRHLDKNTFIRVGSFQYDYPEEDKDVFYDGEAEQSITIC